MLKPLLVPSDKSAFKPKNDKNVCIPVRLNTLFPVGQRTTFCAEFRLFVQDRLFVQSRVWRHDKSRTGCTSCRQGPSDQQAGRSHHQHFLHVHHSGVAGGGQGRAARLRQLSSPKPRCPARAQSENWRGGTGPFKEGAVLQGRERPPGEGNAVVGPDSPPQPRPATSSAVCPNNSSASLASFGHWVMSLTCASIRSSRFSQSAGN